MKAEKKEQIYSDTVEEIISKEIPSILRYGISILFILFALIFAILFRVKFSDTLRVEIVVVQSSPSKLGDSLFINAKIHLGELEMNKIKPGQEIRIILAALPQQDWSVVNGVIDSVNNTSAKKNVTIRIKLKDSFDKTIKIKNGLRGHAEISLEEESLSQILTNSSSIVN